MEDDVEDKDRVEQWKIAKGIREGQEETPTEEEVREAKEEGEVPQRSAARAGESSSSAAASTDEAAGAAAGAAIDSDEARERKENKTKASE